MLRFGIILALLLAALGAGASERRAVRDAEAAAWRGVGRLAVGGRRFCTATLISDRLVLTAAHCLFDPRTRRRVATASLRFVAGLRNGGHAASARVARATLPRGYAFDGQATLRRIGRDVALLELVEPIDGATARPFAVAARLHGPVQTITYARTRPHAPSFQGGCGITGWSGPVASITCTVDHGASGAPVFVEGPDGPEVAAIVSASAKGPGGPVALVVLVAPLLAELAALREGS